jgi:hypothetical protein
LPHAWISEPGRRTVVPNTWANIGELLSAYAPGFRRELWHDTDAYVEIWCEANSMVGVIEPVTRELDVYLRPTQGFSSETLIHKASERINSVGKETFIYQVGDFDSYGMEWWQDVQDRLAASVDVPVGFERIAATVEHRDRYIEFTHPAKKPKNDDKAATTRMRKHTDVYGDRVLEVEAVPSPELRQLTRDAIMRHISQDDIDAVLAQQLQDRATLRELARRYSA